MCIRDRPKGVPPNEWKNSGIRGDSGHARAALLVDPVPPVSQNKLTETTIQWQVVHATTCGVQITPTREITPLRSNPQTQENPARDWVLKNGAKETRTPDPLHVMQVLFGSNPLAQLG